MAKILGIEMPPSFGRKKEEETESGFSIAEAPAPFDTGALLDEATSGMSEHVRDELNEYHAQWARYATERYVSRDESTRNMWVACLEAVRLAGVASKTEVNSPERQQIVESLREKLEEIKGPLAEAIEEKAEEHRKIIEESREATQHELEEKVKEQKERLAQSVSAFAKEGPVIASEELGDTRIQSELDLTRDQIVRGSSSHQLEATALVENERAEMTQREAEYLAAYKEYYSQKGAKESKEPEELIALKETYDASRIAYANALTRSAEKRIAERGIKPGLEGHEDEVLARYNRLVRYNQVIKPAAEKRYEARIEALGSRERGIFAKSLGLLAKSNKWLESKMGEKGARYTRVAATSIIVTGGAAAAGAFGSAGLLSLLGYGSYRLARSLGSSLAGGIAGEAAAAAYGRTRGKRKMESAKLELGYVGRTSSELTLEDLEEFDEERMKLEKEADERTLERRKLLVKALTAVGVGAGVNTVATILSSVSGAAEGVHELAHSEATNHAATTTHHAAPSAATPKEVETVHAHNLESTKGVEIAGKVNNADRLFGRLHDQLLHDYPDAKTAPPAVRTLLENYHAQAGQHAQDVLTRMLHLQNGGSVIMHVGDTLSLRDGSIVFHHAGDNADHVIISSQGVVTPRAELEKFLQYDEPGAPVPQVQPEVVEHATETTPAAPVVHEPIAKPIAAEPAVSAPAPHVEPVHPVEHVVQHPVEQPIHHPAEPVHAAPEHHEAPTAQHQPAAAPVEQVQAPVEPSPEPAAEPVQTVATPQEAPIAPQEVQTQTPMDLIMNKHGVSIDRANPHVYVTGKNDPVVMYGGTQQQRFAAIERYFANPVNQNTVVYSEGDVISPATGKPEVHMYGVDQNANQIVRSSMLKHHGLFNHKPLTLDLDKIKKVIQ